MLADVLLRCAVVAAGGAAGSLARYGLSVWGLSLGTRLPWGTFAANAAGCLLMGGVMQFVVERAVLSDGARLLVAVGLLGGLTTFSTFSYEVVVLARDGHLGSAALYLLASIACGLVGVWLGWGGASLLPLGRT
jgi:CrcB protein